jgi:nicotinamidase-related amidase
MLSQSLLEGSADFLKFLDSWLAGLPQADLGDVIGDPDTAAILSVDVINGFCTFGPLSSPRVNEIVEPIAALFRAAWAKGLRNIVLAQDTHEPDALEFAQWPPHCVRGTFEAETVDAFKALPFFSQIRQIPKNSIHSGLNTALNEWIAAHPQVRTFIVVGDCTDLCTYQLAMHLRLDANARQLERRVVVPIDTVDTYDRPVAVAREQGGLPHPGDLMHAVFLYHMALNGVEVVDRLV